MNIECWHLFTDPRFKLRFNYPATTPEGHAVEKVEEQHDDAVRIHLSSRDSQELYFEVTKYPDLIAREEYERHKAYLEQRFAGFDFAIGELQETSLASRPAHTYTFRWRDAERTVMLIHKDGATYRIIYDPRSPLNAQVLSTVAFPD